MGTMFFGESRTAFEMNEVNQYYNLWFMLETKKVWNLPDFWSPTSKIRFQMVSIISV